jgi:hypothetical protein
MEPRIAFGQTWGGGSPATLRSTKTHISKKQYKIIIFSVNSRMVVFAISDIIIIKTYLVLHGCGVVLLHWYLLKDCWPVQPNAQLVVNSNDGRKKTCDN